MTVRRRCPSRSRRRPEPPSRPLPRALSDARDRGRVDDGPLRSVGPRLEVEPRPHDGCLDRPSRLAERDDDVADHPVGRSFRLDCCVDTPKCFERCGCCCRRLGRPATRRRDRVCSGGAVSSVAPAVVALESPRRRSCAAGSPRRRSRPRHRAMGTGLGNRPLDGRGERQIIDCQTGLDRLAGHRQPDLTESPFGRTARYDRRPALHRPSPAISAGETRSYGDATSPAAFPTVAAPSPCSPNAASQLRRGLLAIEPRQVHPADVDASEHPPLVAGVPHVERRAGHSETEQKSDQEPAGQHRNRPFPRPVLRARRRPRHCSSIPSEATLGSPPSFDPLDGRPRPSPDSVTRRPLARQRQDRRRSSHEQEDAKRDEPHGPGDIRDRHDLPGERPAIALIRSHELEGADQHRDADRHAQASRGTPVATEVDTIEAATNSVQSPVNR